MSDITTSVLYKRGYRVNSKGEWFKPTAPGLQDTVPEPNPVCEAPRPDSTKESGAPGGVHLVITSFRVHLADLDNLAGGCKWLIDALREAGIIRGDSPKDIVSLTVQQAQVQHYVDEHTTVQITVGEYKNPETSGNPPPAAG